MNKKVMIIGAILVVVAIVLALLGGAGSSTSPGIPMPSSTNPNDPAIKGLNLN